MPYTAERIRSRHPFELFFLYVVITTALLGLATPRARPGSVQEGVGHVGTLIWYSTLLLGGLVALAGIFWKERATGLFAEAAGLAISGLCTIFYGCAALIILGAQSLYPAITLLGYGTAALWRAGQIRKLLATVAREHTGNSGG